MKILSSLNKLNIQILIPIVIIQIALTSVLIYFLLNIKQTSVYMKNDTEKANQINNITNKIEDLQQSIEVGLLSYRYHLDDSKLAAIYQEQNEIDSLIQELTPQIVNVEGCRYLNAYNDSRVGFQNIQANLITAVKKGNQKDIEKQYLVWIEKTQGTDMTLSDLSNYNLSQLNSVTADYQNIINRILLLCVLILLGIIFSIFSLYYYLKKLITDPVTKLSTATNKIASGNFNISLPYFRSNELGVLARDISNMAEKLHEYYQHTKRDIKEKELQLAKIKESEDRKNEFISAASHELKTPLTSQKIFVELLMRYISGKEDSELRRYVEKIKDQTAKLIRLVNDLLDVSKIEAGRLVMMPLEFDINQSVLNIIEDFRQSFPENNFKVAGKITRLVYGDKDRTEQVMINLISNAIKYSPHWKTIEVRLKDSTNGAVIDIRDHGIGIAKEHQEEIFNKFYRVAGKDEKTYPGIGMGLYISSEIVKKNGGSIWVKSDIGKGALFGFTIPYTSAKRHYKYFKKIIG